MPLLIVLSLVLQFTCLVHMVRTGRPYWWMWVIMLGSFLGVAVYAFTQILPDLTQDPRARRAFRNARKAIDPEHRKRKIESELQVADTVQNRMRLAAECLDLGDYANAEPLWQSCLRGPHASDPHLMMGLAQAQYGQHKFDEARATLEGLIAQNPDFKSSDGHLLYAKTLEALREYAKALDEYEILATSYPGDEARVRYGLLLISLALREKAEAQFQQVLARSKTAPSYYRKNNREWIALAKEKLDELSRSTPDN